MACWQDWLLQVVLIAAFMVWTEMFPERAPTPLPMASLIAEVSSCSAPRSVELNIPLQKSADLSPVLASPPIFLVGLHCLVSPDSFSMFSEWVTLDVATSITL